MTPKRISDIVHLLFGLQNAQNCFNYVTVMNFKTFTELIYRVIWMFQNRLNKVFSTFLSEAARGRSTGTVFLNIRFWRREFPMCFCQNNRQSICPKNEFVQLNYLIRLLDLIWTKITLEPCKIFWISFAPKLKAASFPCFQESSKRFHRFTSDWAWIKSEMHSSRNLWSI